MTDVYRLLSRRYQQSGWGRGRAQRRGRRSLGTLDRTAAGPDMCQAKKPHFFHGKTGLLSVCYICAGIWELDIANQHLITSDRPQWSSG